MFLNGTELIINLKDFRDYDEIANDGSLFNSFIYALHRDNQTTIEVEIKYLYLNL